MVRMDQTKIMTRQIVAYLYVTPRATALEISQAIGEPDRKVQECLINMDDSGLVIMKAGWYSLSHAERSRIKNGGRA